MNHGLRILWVLALAACDSPPRTLAAGGDAGAPGRSAAAIPDAPVVLPGATRAVLQAGLSSDDYATRLVATDALGCVRDPAVEAWLRYQLGDPEPDVRAAAVGALHRQNALWSRGLLESVRDDADEELSLRVLAAHALVTPSPSCSGKETAQ